MSKEQRFYREEKVSKPDGQEITFEDIVCTPSEKQEQVDALIDKCIKLSCEEQNKKYPLT